jgi:hypothetical protein
VNERSYTIEAKITQTGYSVEIRGEGSARVLWRCSTAFETAVATQQTFGDSIKIVIDLAKHDLDAGFIKDSPN